MHELLHTRLI